MYTSTKTSKKIAETSGIDESGQFANVNKTVSLNLCAAILLMLAFIIWVGGTVAGIILFEHKQINEDDERGIYALTQCIANICLYAGLFILIHVFWHYGLNIEATMKRQKQREQKKKERELDEAIKEVMCDEFP